MAKKGDFVPKKGDKMTKKADFVANKGDKMAKKEDFASEGRQNGKEGGLCRKEGDFASKKGDKMANQAFFVVKKGDKMMNRGFFVGETVWKMAGKTFGVADLGRFACKRFAPRVVSVFGDLTDVDFVGQE